MTNQDMSDFSMLDLFRMELETQAVLLNENLLLLEHQPQSPKELETLMRAAHSIKGAARIVEVEAAVKIAHIMEDCFVAAQAGTITLGADEIDILLGGVDFFLQISQVHESQLDNWLAERDRQVEMLLNAIATILAPEVVGAGLSAVAPTLEPEEIQEIIASAVPPTPEADIENLDQRPTVEDETALTVVTQAQDIPTVVEEAIPLLDRERATTPVPSTIQTSSGIDRVVRVSAHNLNRLMGLAGESLVESNWLHPFADSLLKLKKRQRELSNILAKLRESWTNEHHHQLIEDYLYEAQHKERECREILSTQLEELELFSRRFANLSDSLYREVIASHMRPFLDGVKGFPRMVRDLARKLGKQVKLDIIGESTQVDRDILEKLEAPITHILRNAIDHGIELPAERLALGKPEKGTVRLEATHRAGMLSITIADDGRGIDLEHLRQKVISKQLVTPEMAAQLTEQELMEFIFLPGFSTANAVTEFSGRGVGLDVAQSMVQEVGGTLRAISMSGKGMSFHFQLPLTLSVIRALLVEISGEPYAFSLTRIDRILMIPRDEISVVENRQYFTLNEHNIGIVAAYQVLELKEYAIKADALPVVVISDHLNRYGLVVERFLGECNLVVRPLDARLGKVPDISAAALLEDGSPVLIVDVADLVRSIDNLLNKGKLRRVKQDTNRTQGQKQKRILVVDDSITVREMERKLLENHGYDVEVAVNGMEGWNAIRTNYYDLVISDIDMPRMNGIELVSQIKNHTKFQSLPVIIVSYKDREEDRIRGLETGADYYLTKSSFHDDTLLNAVVDLIGH
ncbi:MAG TPA: hybrid sensor histidine kinase/response regulator [Cyanobacteria bacterium UBA8803]|nr:hybrid sensor histidine kinase/response regulator [Cyanobacteria bacterium UBA9273]HBL60002.1 hybrid sensor histidine kinase/response regulator [Cyanobacteria bacterium UBA8803]